MENFLVAKGVNKVFGSSKNTYTALREVHFNLAKGEFVAVMGPSGAGRVSQPFF